MSIAIRDVREHELDSVLALNNAAGPAILPLDAAKLRQLYDSAEYFRVAERDGHSADDGTDRGARGQPPLGARRERHRADFVLAVAALARVERQPVSVGRRVQPELHLRLAGGALGLALDLEAVGAPRSLVGTGRDADFFDMKGAVEAGLKRLRHSRAHVIGAVLTKLDLNKAAYGYDYHYNYNYSYGAAADDDAAPGRQNS